MQSQHSYGPSCSAIVTDAQAYPNGDVWQQLTTGQSDRDRLDNLIGLALVDQGVHDRLIVRRDRSLLDDFELSEDTRDRLTAIHANSLKEFAQAIVSESVPFLQKTRAGSH